MNPNCVARGVPGGHGPLCPEGSVHEEVAGGVVTSVSLAAANDVHRPEDREKGSLGCAQQRAHRKLRVKAGGTERGFTPFPFRGWSSIPFQLECNPLWPQ